MKKKIVNILAFLSLFIVSCDKPAPVDLVEGPAYSDDPLEVEVLAQNPVEELYSADPDSNLVMAAPLDPRFGSQIVVTRSKTNDGGVQKESALGQAVFYDFNSPVINQMGRTVAFKTKAVQFVKFKGLQAREYPFNFRYLNGPEVKDTLLGPRFLVIRRSGVLGDLFDFEYGSAIDIEVKKFGSPMERFTVATPIEIQGAVNTSRRPDGTRQANVTWNAGNSFSIIIVLSGVAVRTSHIVPLFRIRTRDDGSLVIPPNLLASIPAANFSKLIVTFVREMESLNEAVDERLFFRTQSVNNQVIDLN